MPRARIALAVAAAALAVSACGQPEEANDNPNSQQGDRTVTPPTVLRTPVKVSEAPGVVESPGPDSATQEAPSEG